MYKNMVKCGNTDCNKQTNTHTQIQNIELCTPQMFTLVSFQTIYFVPCMGQLKNQWKWQPDALDPRLRRECFNDVPLTVSHTSVRWQLRVSHSTTKHITYDNWHTLDWYNLRPCQYTFAIPFTSSYIWDGPQIPWLQSLSIIYFHLARWHLMCAPRMNCTSPKTHDNIDRTTAGNRSSLKKFCGKTIDVF